MIQIENLFVKAGERSILKDLNLQINPGEVHSIMGPNGSGKSTLFKAVIGHPELSVSGKILYRNSADQQYENLLNKSPVDRALEGIFMAFQHPVEVPGVNNFNFLHTSFNAVCKHHGSAEMDEKEFLKFAESKLDLLGLDKKFLYHPLNEGLSGGEKKKNELFQMAVLSPTLSLLDELDSGLDIDSIKMLAESLKKMKNKQNAIVLITHYHRLLAEVKPDYVHVLVDGHIKETGDYSLALQVDQTGYDKWM
ncbi:MAG: Fe-S cluster assembly ATPase SufC [Bdellovibrionales bacterium]|nr:Fe-S cluster assembly ATPase SufC [Bdellovibrionales bacterium]